MEIFVSHAHADTEIVERFVDLLQLGMGVREEEIFYSSRAGNIQNGEWFVEKILKRLSKADLIICVVSPAYLKSQFCIAEAGAALMRKIPGEMFEFRWPASVFICLLAPAKPEDLTGIFLGLQVSDILARTTLAELRGKVRDKRGEVNRDETWETQLTSFLNAARVNTSTVNKGAEQ